MRAGISFLKSRRSGVASHRRRGAIFCPCALAGKRHLHLLTVGRATSVSEWMAGRPPAALSSQWWSCAWLCGVSSCHSRPACLPHTQGQVQDRLLQFWSQAGVIIARIGASAHAIPGRVVQASRGCLQEAASQRSPGLPVASRSWGGLAHSRLSPPRAPPPPQCQGN